MNTLFIGVIFCTVLFIYIHINFHYKKSNDLEIFEIDNISKEQLEEICDLKQPFIFNYETNNFKQLDFENISINFKAFDVKIRDKKNYYSNDCDQLFLPIKSENALLLLVNDKEEKYISENNSELLEESSLIKVFESNDIFLRPNLLMSKYYDVISGSLNSTTPLRYNINCRNYLLILNGEIRIKLTPPKSKKFLHEKIDYDNFEFRSLLDVWNIQEEYSNDFNKIKFLEVTLKKNQIIQIPPYWWYSFKILNTKTTILSISYRTYVNNIAIIPQTFTAFLQKQNVKHEIYYTIKAGTNNIENN